MKIIFKEKSFFNEDIEVFDETSLLIAEIIKERGKYNLLHKGNKYFIQADSGFFISKAKIINRYDERDFIILNLKSNFELNFVLDNTDEKYFYQLSYPFINNFHLMNNEKKIILNGSKNIITNNGFVEYHDNLDLKVILFFILIRLSRKELIMPSQST